MEERVRKPFEGVTNIIRFNWHFYVIALLITGSLIVLSFFSTGYLHLLIFLSIVCFCISTLLSLLISFYIYDCTKLYTFSWLHFPCKKEPINIVNINAGFDETSYLLAKKFPRSNLQVFDFYDPKKHTEVSIKRARKRYLAYQNTETVSTSFIPAKEASVDIFFLILSAHEIRNRKERIDFFKQLENRLKKEGNIIVVEHVRNLFNFIAYNIGFLHFFSKKEWKQTFHSSSLIVSKESSITPFIQVFYLQKHEHSS